jgi:polysaccharide pyruvyl transferase WcaK-like protein
MSLDIVVPHNPMKRWKTIGETIYPGPEEWLGYIKHADFVVTNSFHGTVFSVLFNKPFITIGLAGKKSGLNARAKALLNRVGLEHRLLTDLTVDNVETLLQEKIDWASVNNKLSDWRQEALDFINKEIINS